MLKNDFKSTNFANFEEVVHNFGRSDEDMIQCINAYFQYVQTWFDAQLDQKILDGIYCGLEHYYREESEYNFELWVNKRML